MGTYIRLTDYKNSKEKEEKFLEAIDEKTEEKSNTDFTEGQQIRYTANQKDFEKIPGSPIAYWVSDRVKEIFATSQKLGDVGDAKQGLATADNNRFLRYWSEINTSKLKLNCKNREEALESKKKWFPYNKGGDKRKWYGNQEYLVNWENDGDEIKNFEDDKGKIRSRPQNLEFYFRESISWGLITSGGCSFRYFPNGFIYDVAGMSYFTAKDKYKVLGYLNNKLYYGMTKLLNPTINLQIGDVANLPFADFQNDRFEEVVKNCIDIAKEEWDSRETSWDFENCQLIMDNGQLEKIRVNPCVSVANKKEISENSRDSLQKISTAYDTYCQYWTSQFVQLHKNEEELNRLFIEIYGLEEEMTPDVDPEDITLLKKEVKIKKREPQIDTDEHRLDDPEICDNLCNSWLQKKGFKLEFQKAEIIKQFISYTVGCMMGRYSIDKPGLIMANSDDKLTVDNVGANLRVRPDNTTIKITDEKENIRHEIPNARFIPDDDGIIPIIDEDYFDDDITNRFIDIVKTVFGEETLDENLLFIAEALGKKNIETPKECIRRYFINDFMKDHMKRYNKRPIYWLFQSNKKGKAFNALVYLHRYDENTVGRIRQDYMLKYQSKLEAELTNLAKDIEHSNGAEKKNFEKKEKTVSDKVNEIRKYDENVKYYTEQRIKLDLDDGVKVNYGKLYDILYEEKSLKPKK